MKKKTKATGSKKTVTSSTKKTVAKKAISRPKAKAPEVRASKSASIKKPSISASKKLTIDKSAIDKPATKSASRGPRIGIFGGSFNPFHNGHLCSLQEVIKLAKLDQIFVVPSNQNPLKVLTDGPTSQERLAMVRLGLGGFESQFPVDDQEIRRGGVTYTIETLRNYRKKYEADQIFLIIGADLLESLPKWKEFPELIKQTNFIVTTRPGFHLPVDKAEVPGALQNFVTQLKGKKATLSTGRTMEFVTLKDVEASATTIRRRRRTALSIHDLVPEAVDRYIEENGFYQGSGRIVDYAEFVKECAQFLFDRKAVNLKGYDLRKLNGITDYVIIASGTSTRHVSSMAETLVQQIKQFTGVRPLGIEGTGEGRWVVLDYGSLIIHLFYDFVRQEYRLEDLWRQGQDLGLKDGTMTLAGNA